MNARGAAQALIRGESSEAIRAAPLIGKVKDGRVEKLIIKSIAANGLTKAATQRCGWTSR